MTESWLQAKEISFFRLKTFGTNINNSRFLTGWILNAYLLCVFITSIY